ncbi:MAG: carboxypeptidase regulatory-like domain-containing protein, partial [Planctomycetota bacterium]
PGGSAAAEIVMAAIAPLSGKVTDPSGKPLEDVRVHAGEDVSTETDAKGKFTLKSLPKSVAVTVWFSRDGYVSSSETLAGGTGIPAEVVLQPASVLAGKVLDDEGRPIAGVRAIVRWQGGSHQIETKADGSFRFAELEPGTYTVVAHREGFAPKSTPAMTLREGERREDIVIRLPVGVEARVEPVLPDGTRANARVVIYGPLESPKEERITASASRRGTERPIQFQVMPGRYRIIVSGGWEHQDAGAVEVEHDIAASDVIRIALTGKAQRILIRPTLPPEGRPNGLSLRRTHPPEPPVSFWLWGEEMYSEEENLVRSPPLPDGTYAIGLYYQIGEDGGWHYKEIEGLEPGGDPVPLDLTK